MYNKYKAKKIISSDGTKFSSLLEHRFYKFMIGDSRIKIKTLQPRFILQEGFVHDGKKIRPIEYVADFTINVDGDEYIVDAKGMETPEFKIKRKMFWKKYGQENRLIVVKSIKELQKILFSNP